MPTNWTTNTQFALPPAANAISITPSGVSWGSSGYTTIVASTTEADVLTGIILVASGAFLQFEVDVAVGAAASEVVIATVKGAGITSPFDVGRGSILRLPIGIDAIPNGSRLSFRIRVSTTSVVAWTFAFTYLKKPIVGNYLTTAKPSKVVPSAASLIALSTSAASYANVAWVEIVTSTTTAQVLNALILLEGNFDYEVEVGIGAAGAEVPITIWRNTSIGTITGHDWNGLTNPLNAIPIGSRVAMRWRNSAASAVLNAGYGYHEGPL